MKCKCGYKGLAEIGDFPDERMNGEFIDDPRMNVPFRCPFCQSNKNLEYINSIDSIREALIFPRGRTVSFITGGGDKTTVGYCIMNSNKFGCGSTISITEYENLKKEFANKLNLDKISQDCDTALRSIGIDPKVLDENMKNFAKKLDDMGFLDEFKNKEKKK